MASEPPAPARADEFDAIVELVADQQGHPERAITYVGTERQGIRAELDGLEPPWATTARVVHADDAIVGAVVVEWDEESGRAWILGPWVAGDAVAWDDHADALLDAALAQLPPTITRCELSGDVANVLLGELASGRGWEPTEANHALLADAATVAEWPVDDEAAGEFRPPEPNDIPAVAVLHDAEFPGTYASAEQLVAGHADGSRIVLVAPAAGGDGVAGYAAGQIHPDGEGFIDFVVVDPATRGTGLGRRLVVALTRELLARSTIGRVALTVQDHRTTARTLYERLGFRPDGSFVAYRNW